MESPIPRHSRHMLIGAIGWEGQRRIEASRVLVAGLGALGSLIADLLARAGVGFLRIVDLDGPELHNLHRQLLYDETDLGKGLSKAQIAEAKLRAANSEIEIDAVTAAIGPENAHALVAGVDLVVDALDNIRSRYFINDAVVELGIPYVFGGAVGTWGNVMTIIPGETPCLRCLWPDPQAVADHPVAADLGVLSSAATAIASIEVTEALKILAGKEDQRMEGLLTVDVWKPGFHVAAVAADPSCACRNAGRK